MSPFFAKTLKITNLFLSPLGVRLQACKPRRWFPPPTVLTRVGGFEIEVPTINPICDHYERFPDYMAHLGRLAGLVQKVCPGFSTIDVGANVGDTACILKAACPGTPVLCIEGDAFTFGFLQKNVSRLPGVQANCQFLGESCGSLSVRVGKAGWNTTLVPGTGANSQALSLRSLDDVIADHPEFRGAKLLKVDAEGFDCRILRGARQLLETARPIVTFEYNRENMREIGENGKDTIEMLMQLGYSALALHDSDGRFFAGVELQNTRFIQDIHNYADGTNGAIYYFDMTVFHSEDEKVAIQFFDIERQALRGPSGATNL